jgi:hypothetical protein
MSKINLDNYEAFLLDYAEGNLSENDIMELKTFALTHPELEIDLAENDLPYFAANPVDIDFKDDLKKTEDDLLNEEILHYMEGLLSPEEKIAFEARLVNDKHLALLLSQYQNTILSANADEIFENRSSLLKTEDDLIVSNKVISYVEDQLSAEEKFEFEKELAFNKNLQNEYALVLNTKLVADAAVVYPNKNELKKQPKIITLFNFRAAGALAAAILLVLLFVFVFNYYNKPAYSGKIIVKNSANRGKDSSQAAVTKEDPLPPVPGNKSQQKTAGRVSKSLEIPQEKEEEELIVKSDPIQNEKENKKQNKSQGQEIKIPVEHQPNNQEGISSNTISPPKNDSVVNKQNYVVEVAYGDNDDIEKAMQSNNNKGFWKRAARFAGQVNKLGVKSIDGQENDGQKYRLSFNSFTVEKK